MNPIVNLLSMKQGINGGQNRNMMLSAMQAMMSGKSPQEFLRSISNYLCYQFNHS